MNESVFCPLQPFDASGYAFLGAGGRRLALEDLVNSEDKEPELDRKLRRLKRRHAKRRLGELARTAASAVSAGGLLTISSATAAVVAASGGRTAQAAFAAAAAAVTAFFTWLWRTDHRHKSFLVSDAADAELMRSRRNRHDLRREMNGLETELGAWDAIPASVRPDVRRLVSLIREYDSDVRFFNAEAESSRLLVRRGHRLMSQVEPGLAATRATLETQRREIVETVISATNACIAAVCRPDGEHACLSAELDGLRKKLDKSSQAAPDDETLLRREIPSLREDDGRRLAAAAAAAKEARRR